MSNTIEVTMKGDLTLDEAEAYANDLLTKVKAERDKPKQPEFRVGEVWSAVDPKHRMHYFVVAEAPKYCDYDFALWRLGVDADESLPDSNHWDYATYCDWLYWSGLRNGSDGKRPDYKYTGWRKSFNADGSRAR